MKYKVYVIVDAEEDIFEIYQYIAVNDSIGNADKVFKKIKDSCLSLSKMPNRGHIPPELERINISDYREIHCQPYRIIYQVRKTEVFIHCVLDGRREIQEILEKRLLR